MAALGLLINEKAGIVNLGAEGMMLCAAIAGFATVVHTGNDWLGFAAGMARGRCWPPSLAAGDLAQHQPVRHRAGAQPVRRGLLGLCRHQATCRPKLPERPKFAIPVLGDMPLLGPALFRQHPLVYLTMLLVRGADLVPVPHPRAWCCARWASRPSRPMRWATRCAASAWRP
jgi:hypothetical protein